jgi:carbon-monoxide dehydrogenase medium subunit
VNAFDYRAPRMLDDALAILEEHGGDARVIAGGTALVTMMRQRLVQPGCLVSLRDVAGLGRIEARNGAVRIGALVTHREAETSPLLQERLPVLAETFRRVGTIRIRPDSRERIICEGMAYAAILCMCEVEHTRCRFFK